MQSVPLVWTTRLQQNLYDQLADVAGGYRKASSLNEFLKVAREDPTAVAFLDEQALQKLVDKVDDVPLPGRIIAVCDGPLHQTIGWVTGHAWLSHVVTPAMLQHPMGTEHLRNVLSTFAAPIPRLLDWIGPEVAGRRVRLTQASKRTERLERMSDFFAEKGVGPRNVEQLRDAAEELLTNAFYNAPVAAGAAKGAISRTQDVLLPDDDACDLVYGCRDDLALVRVRDPFGALSRTRLIEVLTRCARTDMKVEVDETMGGAGLGLWRIVSVASFVTISVLSHRHTEFLVGIAKRAPAGARPFAFHMFFREGTKRRFWQIWDADSSLTEESVVLK